MARREEGNYPRLNLILSLSLFPCFINHSFNCLFGSVTSELMFLPPNEETFIYSGATRSKRLVIQPGFGIYQVDNSSASPVGGKTRGDRSSRRTGLSVPINTFLT